MNPPAGLTVGDLLEESTRRLAEGGVPDPRRDAIALAGHVLGIDRGGVLAHRPDPIPAPSAEAVRSLVSMRAQRRPLQHVLGSAVFSDLEFEVNPSVLIPRPETEDLVAAVLGAGLADRARVADLGTGSGALAVVLAVARPLWGLVAVDRSAGALEVARRNATRHGVADRITFVEADFATLPSRAGGPFDAIVSNPPYVSEEEWRGLEPEVRDHEPKLALVPGETGHEAYAAIAPAAASRLVPGGLLVLELGWKSEAAVRAIVAAAGFLEVVVRPDLSGIPRILTARR